MESESAEIIRNRMRESTCAERARHRRDKYSEKRCMKTEKAESVFDENDVIAAALAIAINSSDKIEALKILKQSFIENSTHIVTFIKVEGASHALVKHLLSHNSMEQLLALECCCNLSLGDSKTCFKLAKCATPYLINILQGLNYNLMNVAIITLGNLSGSGKKTCNLLLAQGVLKSFEHTISIPELRESTGKAMVQFSKIYLNDLSEEECQSMVQSCLPHYETSPSIQWLLYHFSSLNPTKSHLISANIPERIIHSLFELKTITPDNIISITGQVRTIALLATDPDGATVQSLLDNWPKTLHVIKFLMQSNYRHLCKELCWALGNIIRHDSPNIRNQLAAKAEDLNSIISYVPVV